MRMRARIIPVREASRECAVLYCAVLCLQWRGAKWDNEKASGTGPHPNIESSKIKYCMYSVGFVFGMKHR